MAKTSSIYQNAFDDDFAWDGGNIVPWGPSNSIAQHVATNLVGYCGYDSLGVESRGQKSLDTFQASSMDVTTSDDGCSADETDLAAVRSSDGDTFPLMDLPVEIRLLVYHWLYLMTPVKLFRFGPVHPAPVNKPYLARAVMADVDVDPPCSAASRTQLLQNVSVTNTKEFKQFYPDPLPLLSPYRPSCAMPTAILRVSKQVYYECRQIPFLANEFAFVGWFASGLRAARALLKGLQRWQIGSMRYVRLELISRDLSEAFADEWRELCEGWGPGLQGLRLKIVGGDNAYGAFVARSLCQNEGRTVEVRDSEGLAQGWVEHGLKLLRQLRRLEVELVFPGWDNRAKIEWCRHLETALNEPRADAEHRVRVSCVEKVDN
ncbi:hypothetical protein F4779DRAFT_521380 [Xylariaceae sp. FL0662B]|nr:hypothetical protein F4779DRAFT_521380 [Xylariaceae sp. FL0662B]